MNNLKIVTFYVVAFVKTLEYLLITSSEDISKNILLATSEDGSLLLLSDFGGLPLRKF